MTTQPHNPLPFLEDRLAHEKAKLDTAPKSSNTEPIKKVIRETENAIAWVEEIDLEKRGLLLQAMAMQAKIEDRS